MNEQMYSGLDSLVIRTLNEKKQEISPEDQRDNELIRSAMKKRVSGRANTKLTKDEQDALERNGWTVDGRKFKTANANFEFKAPSRNGYYSDSDRLVYLDDKRNYSRDDAPVGPLYKNYRDVSTDNYVPVNLADMGRKHIERAKNNPYKNVYGYDLSGVKEKRGAKLQKGAKLDKNDNWNNRPLIRNRLFAEREYGNPTQIGGYKDFYRDVASKDSWINDATKNIDREYDYSERDRKEYLRQIEYYKKKLSELDGRVDRDVQRQKERIDRYKKDKEDIMAKARAKFSQRNNKNESLRRRKNGKRFV